MAVEMAPGTEHCGLRLEGSWTIERATELKHLLVEALKSDKPVIIELDGLEGLDLACLQLLCAAHRASLRLGKRLELQQEKPDILKRVMREAGFARTLGCHKDPNKSCLWIGDWES